LTVKGRERKVKRLEMCSSISLKHEYGLQEKERERKQENEASFGSNFKMWLHFPFLQKRRITA
jgi:hypothetical protein